MRLPVRRQQMALCLALLTTILSVHALSDLTRSIKDHLWQQVEESVPVVTAQVTKVVDTPTYIDLGPDPAKTMYQTHTFTQSRIDHLKFPKRFVYGMASSAAQFEGAVKDDDRGPSVWDSYCHRVPQQPASTCQAIDIGTNFRYLYPLDLARVAALGTKAFSFSISWSRVMPLGVGEISEEGLHYYLDLVDEIVGQGMEPVASLFHFDLPLHLEIKYGGFTNERIVDDFVQYAVLILKELNERGVRMWFTFNDPQSWCFERYPLVRPHVHGQQVDMDASVPWKCTANLLKAHGKAVEAFRQMQHNNTISPKAKISYKSDGSYNVPWREHHRGDKQVVKRVTSFTLGLFADPIHKTGNYPALVRDEVPQDWLPELSTEDSKRLKGSADFFATNYFASGIAKATEREGGLDRCVGNTNHPAWPSCGDMTATLPDGQLLGEKADSLVETWLMNTAGLLRRHLKYIYDRYGSKEIIISEFGWAESNEADKSDMADIKKDLGRERYMLDYLAEMLLAIYKEGVPLVGAFAWAITDNVDWEKGLQLRFGVQSIDFRLPEMPRIFKNSAFLLHHFFTTH